MVLIHGAPTHVRLYRLVVREGKKAKKRKGEATPVGSNPSCGGKRNTCTAVAKRFVGIAIAPNHGTAKRKGMCKSVWASEVLPSQNPPRFRDMDCSIYTKKRANGELLLFRNHPQHGATMQLHDITSRIAAGVCAQPIVDRWINSAGGNTALLHY